MTSYPQRAVARLAARQNGNVTRAQLRELGLGEAAIDYKLRHGQLHREHAGVYSVGRPARTPIERATAAVLACGAGALLSHESALALWGLATRWPARMHVTTPADRRPSGIVVHQSRTLARADARLHLGVRVTSPARTLHDCAPTLSHRALTRAVNDALRSPFMSRAQLEEMAQRGKRLLPFTVAPTGPTRSEFEDRFLEFCAQHGLPRPRVNTRVIGYEVDALFADERVIVELDSWRFHSPHAAFESDRNRDADLLAAGYATVRITWARLIGAPAAEAARLRTILASRASAPRARSAPAS